MFSDLQNEISFRMFSDLHFKEDPKLRKSEKKEPGGQMGCYVVVTNQGLVVQSIVSLTSLLRDQLVKCFTAL